MSKHKEKRSGHNKQTGKYLRYQTRSTCVACSRVFRSPKKRLAHVESGHKIMTGWNEKRSAKGVSAFSQ